MTEHRQEQAFPWLGVVFGAILIALGLGGWFLLSQEQASNKTVAQQVESPKESPALGNVALMAPATATRTGGTSPARTATGTDTTMLAASAQPSSPPPADEPPVIKAPPTPPLDQSDEWVIEQLPLADIASRLAKPDLVRKGVVFIDNLADGDVLYQHSPLSPLTQPFRVVEQDNFSYPDKANFQRYRPYLDWLEKVDMAQWLAFYHQLRPLIGKAAQELGYDADYIDRRLLETIDLMLATPDISDNYALVSPRAMYQFADPQLEALPGAQKLLLRMGRENRLRFQQWLRRFRRALRQ